MYFSALMDLLFCIYYYCCCCSVCTALLFSYSAIFLDASVRNKLIHSFMSTVLHGTTARRVISLDMSFDVCRNWKCFAVKHYLVQHIRMRNVTKFGRRTAMVILNKVFSHHQTERSNWKALREFILLFRQILFFSCVLHYIKLLPGICQFIVTLAIALLFACTFVICNKILLTYLLTYYNRCYHHHHQMTAFKTVHVLIPIALT